MKETKLTVKLTTTFKKDYKMAMKRGRKLELIDKVITTLALGENLPNENRDHDLHGNYKLYKLYRQSMTEGGETPSVFVYTSPLLC